MRTVLAASCLLLLTCCGDPRAGTYATDMEATVDAMVGELPEEVKAMARDAMRAMEGLHLELTLASDRTWSGVSRFPAVMGAPARETTSRGTWEVSGDAVTLRQTHEDGRESPKVQNATFVGSSELHLQGIGGQTLVMRKR